jgi:hypothetical protein
MNNYTPPGEREKRKPGEPEDDDPEDDDPEDD